jgi:hypothetical protein
MGLAWIDALVWSSVWLALAAAALLAASARALGVVPVPALLGARRTRAVAGAILATGLGGALLGPAPVRPLAALPLAMALALAFYRPGERYGGLAVDGALLVGALAALALGSRAS